MSFSPYDPYVPYEPNLDLLRRDAIRRAAGRIPVEDGGLYRVLDSESRGVVTEGSRDTCLAAVLDAWWRMSWVPGPSARARARGAALRLTFERWDDPHHQWTRDPTLTGAIVAQHALS